MLVVIQNWQYKIKKTIFFSICCSINSVILESKLTTLWIKMGNTSDLAHRISQAGYRLRFELWTCYLWWSVVMALSVQSTTALVVMINLPCHSSIQANACLCPRTKISLIACGAKSRKWFTSSETELDQYGQVCTHVSTSSTRYQWCTHGCTNTSVRTSSSWYINNVVDEWMNIPASSTMKFSC